MKQSDIEKERIVIDEDFDGFLEFVEMCSLGDLMIVHRDEKKWLGVIDKIGNVVLPLIYDSIRITPCGLELTIVDYDNIELKGFATFNAHIVIPAYFKALYPIGDIIFFWCLDINNDWYLYDIYDNHQEKLPLDLIPLDSQSQVCVLRKKSDCDFVVECWDKNGNSSQLNLRTLALNSDVPGRIIFNFRHYNLIIYSDIYGHVLYSNINLNVIFR